MDNDKKEKNLQEKEQQVIEENQQKNDDFHFDQDIYDQFDKYTDKQFIFDSMMERSGFEYYDHKSGIKRLKFKKSDINPFYRDPQYEKVEDKEIKGIRKERERIYEECVENFSNGCMTGYFLADEIKSNILSYRDFISQDEAYIILCAEENAKDLDIGIEDKNFLLSQLYCRIQSRKEENSKVDNNLGEDLELRKEFITCLKTNYIMDTNENIKNAIKLTEGSSNSYSFLKKFLATMVRVDSTYIAKDVNYDDLMKKRIRRGLKGFIGINQGDDENFCGDRLDNLIDGMRHEFGFQDIVESIKPDVVKIEEISPTRKQDSMGVDYFLEAKISKEKADNGQYVYANEEEINNDGYYPIRILVDVKKSKSEADKKNNKSYTGSSQNSEEDIATKNKIRLAMWSYIFPQDFRVPKNVHVDLDSDSMSAKGSKGESVHLTSVQKDKLEKLKETRSMPGQYRVWSEEGLPISLDDRRKDLLKNVIASINSNPDKVIDIINYIKSHKTIDTAS